MSDATIKKLIEQRKLFYVLDNLQLKYKTAVVSKADRKLIKSICDGILNLLNGNIPLSDIDKDKLRKYRTTLRKIISKSTLKDKRKLLVQRGGSILGILIPTIVSGLTSLISGFIGNNEART